MADANRAALTPGGSALLAGGIFLSVLNASMATVVLPAVQRDFAVPDDALTWFVTGFLIPFAIGTVVYGRLADALALRPLYLSGILLFSAGSFAVSLAPGFWLTVGARAVQGAGATALPALTVPAIVRTATGKRRDSALGAVVLAVGAGFGLGPLVGGSLAEWWGWRAPFILSGGAGVLLSFAARALLPRFAGSGPARLDPVGLALLATAVGSTLYAVSRLGRADEDRLVVATGAAALPLWVAFLGTSFWRPEPVVPFALWQRSRFVLLCLTGASAQAAHFGAIVLVPLFLARYEGLSNVETGLWMAPGAAALGLAGVATARLGRRANPGGMLVAAMWLLLVAAAFLHMLAFAFPTSAVAGTYAALAAGFGVANTTSLRAVAEELPERSVGVGVGIFNLAFFLGGASSVSLAGAILQARGATTASWNPFVATRATEFADAALVPFAAAALGFAASVLYGRTLPIPRLERWQPAPRLASLRWKPNRRRR